ncbi:MAG: NADH-quinone oxidoreductase subunit J [Gammaproteobacteria bacterium]|nr:NADH-quinone oxidoreductase subunit J [Gammaproteobacteria bacterium]NIW47126.1 NADH-quinone oxidoreductase subunit J [Gammaproteobacteria bacterium]NIX01792.1 NADH-quinone oxidoreductase subunit J [Phycisphaerae bacterium]
MELVFYIASAVAVISTIMVITRLNAVHALLYLIVSLLAVAVIFFILGAPFIAALEVIIYAGAIMVLFIFVVMMLNIAEATDQERSWLKPGGWVGPSVLVAILFFPFIFNVAKFGNQQFSAGVIDPQQVGSTLFGPYLIGVELSAMLLLAGIIGAYHLGRRKKKARHRFMEGAEE